MGQLWRKPLGSLLTASVIGIALTLPAGFYTLLSNAETVTRDWGGAIEITAFLQPGLTQSRVKQLSEELQQRPEISAVRYMSEEQAFAEYQQLSGFSRALEMLDENPLPSLLLIDIDNSIAQAQVEELTATLGQMADIDTVVLDRQWLQRLQLIIETVRRAVVVISVLLALGVLLIVGNTIRLNINNNRREIEIIKLFGGTNAFIQRPFLYSGFWYGVFGGILAWCLVSISILLLSGPVRELAALYQSQFSLHYLGIIEILLLLMAGGLLGLVGSWISVAQHIRHIEPQ